jgi:hypothetical protein
VFRIRHFCAGRALLGRRDVPVACITLRGPRHHSQAFRSLYRWRQAAAAVASTCAAVLRYGAGIVTAHTLKAALLLANVPIAACTRRRLVKHVQQETYCGEVRLDRWFRLLLGHPRCVLHRCNRGIIAAVHYGPPATQPRRRPEPESGAPRGSHGLPSPCQGHRATRGGGAAGLGWRRRR